MIIFAGVDGTGVWNDPDYEKTMQFSFVNQLFRSWTDGPPHYERGPVTADCKPSNLTIVSSYYTYRHVVSNWKAGESAVFLAGYSRGGAAVIEVAKALDDDYIPVECLILFDAVDRTPFAGVLWHDRPIPGNVKQVIYAKRSPASKSRESFGNCGLMMENGQPTPYKEFFATHAAMGGSYWPPPARGGLINEGFPDGLTALTDAADHVGGTQVQQWTFSLIENALYDCRKRLS